jgi:hypothetical protein
MFRKNVTKLIVFRLAALSYLLLVICCTAGVALSQNLPDQQSLANPQNLLKIPRKNCPGDPPGNLSSFDCSFHESTRFEQFVSGSVTDQAVLSATFFGFVAQLRKDPNEWKQDWGGFGYRVGSRYAQNMAKGLTEYGFGALMRVDPRHTTYASDPRIQQHKTGVTPRIGHAFMDWLTVRRSSPDGNGRALPNLPLFLGAGASGFSGYAWYPDRLATPGQAALRGSSSLGTALAASFYAEFQPEISRLLGAIFKSKAPAQPQPPKPQATNQVTSKENQ